MKWKEVLFAGCFIALFQVGLQAQNTNWGQLSISLPAGWGTNMKAGNLVYSNYNLTEAEPFSITLFKPEPIPATTDSLFYVAWRRYLAPMLTTQDIPRPKRWNTEGELPLFTATKESIDKTNPAFYVFGVYLLPGSYQAFLIHTQMAKTYRNVQSEWQERLLGVALTGPSKK